jgi:lysophospholipase
MFRKAALAFAMVLAFGQLAACSPRDARAPVADTDLPPSLSPRFYPPEGWTWGLVKAADAPAQRYGVSGPRLAPRGSILILTGYDDPAETWFETVSALNRRGYVVWLLERAGQGGSGRLSRRRDLGHVDSFAPDAAAVQTMVRTIIRPRDGSPLVMLGHSVGGLVALRAVQDGTPIAGLILSAPSVEPYDGAPSLATARLARGLGLGWLRAPGQGGWRRLASKGAPEQLTHDPARTAMRQAWPAANPALRMGGPSYAWVAAFGDAAEAAKSAAPRIATSTLTIIAGDDAPAGQSAARGLCASMPTCRETTIGGAWRDLPRETDAARGPWLDAVDGFMRQAAGKARR